MHHVTELVDLPDPAVQPLVHPLDVPEARRSFRTSWWIAASTSPPVALCVAALVWFAGRSYVVPLVAAATTIGLGLLASRSHRDRAWAFIPRKRQDRRRRPPAAWELGSGLLSAALLATTLLLVAFRLAGADVAPGVRGFAFGTGAAAGLLVVVDVASRLLRHRGDDRRRALFRLPGVVAVVVGVAVSYRVLFDATGVPSTEVPAGAAVMLLVGAGVGMWTYLRRAAPAGDMAR